MPYEIRWDQKAREFLKTLDPQTAQQIIRKANSIVDFPEHYLEYLVEIDAYKLRSGDYRMIIDLDKQNEIILVRLIGHRKNVYDRL